MLILKIIFYIVTFVLIVMYFFKEKYIVDNINNFVEKVYYKLNVKNIVEKNNISQKFILSISLISSIFIFLLFYFKIDKNPDEDVKIKLYAVIITILINIVSILFNKKQEYIFIMNLVLLLGSGLLFNIYDKYYNIAIIIAMITNLILIILNKELLQKLKKIANLLFLFILVIIIQTYYIGNYTIPTGSMLPTIQLGDRIFSNNFIYKFKDPKLGDIISFKEPMNNRWMYTKRITGIAGTLIKIDDDGNLYSNDEIVFNRKYTKAGFIGNSNIYIPKKGDEVKLALLYEISKKDGSLKIITGEEFLEKYKNYTSYKNLFGRYSRDLDENSEYVYEFSLKSNNSDYYSMPILEFKYDKDLMDKLLSGESVVLKENYYVMMGDNTNNSLDSRYFGTIAESKISGKLLLRWYPLNRIGRLD